MKEATNRERLESSSGICTSIALTDTENYKVMQLVLTAFISGVHLETARRTTDDWEVLEDLPMNFCDFMFRAR